MITEQFIGQVLDKVKASPMGEVIPLNKQHSGYLPTVLAIKTIINRELDKVWGFDLLFITRDIIERLPGETDDEYFDREMVWWREKRRIPGEDYMPYGFKKYQPFDQL